MRDHTRLKAYQLTDQLVVDVYPATKVFPREEIFGLTSQMRRAAVSIPSNIVEGCARRTESDYLHFLTMAYGSASELEYQLKLARLGYLAQDAPVLARSTEVCKVLNGLIRSMEK